MLSEITIASSYSPAIATHALFRSLISSLSLCPLHPVRPHVDPLDHSEQLLVWRKLSRKKQEAAVQTQGLFSHRLTST